MDTQNLYTCISTHVCIHGHTHTRARAHAHTHTHTHTIVTYCHINNDIVTDTGKKTLWER